MYTEQKRKTVELEFQLKNILNRGKSKKEKTEEWLHCKQKEEEKLEAF